LKYIFSHVLKAHSRFKLENQLLKPDKLSFSAVSSKYYKCCIDHQWKNAFCLVDSKDGSLELHGDKHSTGLYFHVGKQILSASEGVLRVCLKIGRYEKVILHKRSEALHHNWDLFFYSFNVEEKSALLGNHGCLEVKWSVNTSNSRILISPPFLKRNQKDTHRIVVLVADSIRPEDLGIYNRNSPTYTPNIDELASNGAVFTNSYSQSNWTLPTFASMATSLYASQHNVVNPNLYMRAIDRNVPTLAELLKMNDFFTYAEVSHRRCNQSLGHHRGYDYFRYQQTLEEGNSMTTQLRNACNSLRNIKGMSMFMFLHIFDTHSPYIFDKDGVVTKNLLKPHRLKHYIELSKRKELSYSEYDYIKERYISKLSRLDTALKELLGYIYEDENATLILTSDHGFSFDQSATDYNLSDSLIKTPFIVYSNPFSIKKGVYNSVVESSIDIFSTIVSLYKIDDSFPRSGTKIFDEDFNVIDKQYAVSECVYNDNYQLKLVDKDGFFITFGSDRDAKSFEINSSKMQIIESDKGPLRIDDFKGRFSSYITESKLNPMIIRSVLETIEKCD